MKVAEEESSKILARAEITESTQRLSVKKQKEVFLYWNQPSFLPFWPPLYIIHKSKPLFYTIRMELVTQKLNVQTEVANQVDLVLKVIHRNIIWQKLFFLIGDFVSYLNVGYGVCCIFTLGCSEKASENCTYFEVIAISLPYDEMNLPIDF